MELIQFNKKKIVDAFTQAIFDGAGKKKVLMNTYCMEAPLSESGSKWGLPWCGELHLSSAVSHGLTDRQIRSQEVRTEQILLLRWEWDSQFVD